MRKLLKWSILVMVILALALSTGCGKKDEPTTPSEATTATDATGTTAAPVTPEAGAVTTPSTTDAPVPDATSTN